MFAFSNRLPVTQNPPRIHLDYLVVGTGRCGSVYMARLLSSLGITCGHESVFGTGGLEYARYFLQTGDLQTSPVSRLDIRTSQAHENWFEVTRMRAESSWMAAPFLDHPCASSAALLHLVRHPLDVIRSYARDVGMFREGADNPFAPFRDFALAHLPGIAQGRSELERTCLFWIGWNERIARHARDRPYLLHAVEHGVTTELLDFLGLPPHARAAAFADDRINSWRRDGEDDVLLLDDIPRGETRDRLVEVAARLGYPDPQATPVGVATDQAVLGVGMA